VNSAYASEPVENQGCEGEAGGSVNNTLTNEMNSGETPTNEPVGAGAETPNDEPEGNEAEFLNLVRTAKRLKHKMSRKQMKLFSKELKELQCEEDQAALEEMQEHRRSGHRSKLTLNDRCEECQRGTMKMKGAFAGASKKALRLATANIDTLDMIQKSIAGNRYCLNMVINGTQYGDIATSANKDSVSTTRGYRQMKQRIEAFTDPGGKSGYKVQSVKRDPGTEFLGEMKSAMAEDNIIDVAGEVNRHTENAIVENRHRILQNMSATMSITAFEGEHEQSEELTTAAWDEVQATASQLMNHTCITETQKRAGVTAAEEQSHGRVCSSDEVARYRTVGEGALAFVPKAKRASKHSPRAVKAIFVGFDMNTPGAARLMPYAVRDGKWVLYPAVVCKTWRHIPNYFPLHASATNDDAYRLPDNLATRWTLEGQLAPTEVVDTTTVDSSEWDYDRRVPNDEIDDQTEYEPELILDHTIDEIGRVFYEVKWVGFSAEPEDTTWHNEDDLCDCVRLISEYWSKRSTGVFASIMGVAGDEQCQLRETDGSICAASMEVSWDEWWAESRRDRSRAAMDKEVKAMTEKIFKGADLPRLVRLTDKEVNELTEYEKKRCLKGRFCLTDKRDGQAKARIVAQDLKTTNQLPAEEVFAATPAMSAFRFMLAASPRSEYVIHTTDFNTAYLQGAPRFPKSYQDSQVVTRRGHILFKLWRNETNSWEYYDLTGFIYGQQPAGSNWKQTLSSFLESKECGFIESKNAPSTYFNQESGTRLSVFVDDPVGASPRDVCDDDTNRKSNAMTTFYQKLGERFEHKDVRVLEKGEDIDYLSMRLAVDNDGWSTLSNPSYVRKLVNDAGLADCNAAKAPLSKDTLKEIAGEVELEQFLDNQGKTEFQSAMGEFQWLVQTTHPDIAVATSALSKYCSKPTPTCIKAVKQVIRYLSGRVEQGFRYDKGDGTGLVVWSDSDHAGLHAINGELRSRMGIAVMYNGHLIHWVSKLIQGIMTSSCEAELHALSEAVRLAMHFRYIGEELGIPMPTRVPVMVDAAAAIAFANNTLGVGRMKHLDLRSAWVRQVKTCEHVEITKVKGTVNVADYFTKILPVGQFRDDTQALIQPLHVGGHVDIQVTQTVANTEQRG
jgi:hypothetical protein